MGVKFPKLMRENSALPGAFKFIALFLASSIAAYAVLLPLRELNAFAAASGQFLLSALFGISSAVSYSGQYPLLSFDGVSAQFLDLCSAKLELAVLFGIIFASFEKPFSYRVKGFVAGAAMLLAFNAFRIALTLSLLQSGNLAWSAVLHDVFFRASLVIVLVTFYAIWYYYAIPRKPKPKPRR